jgi:two-component system, OmpR family, sensor kinase
MIRRVPGGWRTLHGVHRRLVAFLLLAMALGAVGGAGLYASIAVGVGHPACVAVAVVLSAWPLGWLATMRIVRPLQDLARVAAELHGGQLGRRALLAADREDEVGEVAGALRGMADRVAKQLADQRALMAAVSHELRSPLGRVRVLVELLREGSAPPGAHDDLQAEIDGMDALVGDLLAAARIDFEALAPRTLVAREVALRALEVARLPAEALQGDGAGVTVRADATLLARALSGLLDNARRYGATEVVLRVEARGDRVVFAVEDDGPGFPEGGAEQAFEPFWRGPAADGGAAPRGEGLGLALVRQVAEAHGGAAGAEDRPGGGARVWVALPR